MEQAMNTATNVAVTNKSTRETSRELTENELAHVSGGIIAVLVGGPLMGTYDKGLGSPEELQVRK
jgi:lactobin A/cerein 7B family class IIb bacteriocin